MGNLEKNGSLLTRLWRSRGYNTLKTTRK